MASRTSTPPWAAPSPRRRDRQQRYMYYGTAIDMKWRSTTPCPMNQDSTATAQHLDVLVNGRCNLACWADGYQQHVNPSDCVGDVDYVVMALPRAQAFTWRRRHPGSLRLDNDQLDALGVCPRHGGGERGRRRGWHFVTSTTHRGSKNDDYVEICNGPGNTYECGCSDIPEGCDVLRRQPA